MRPTFTVNKSGFSAEPIPQPDPTYGEVYTLLRRTLAAPAVGAAPSMDILNEEQWNFLVANLNRILSDEDLQERFRNESDETNALFRRCVKMVGKRAHQIEQVRLEAELLSERNQRESEAERNRAIKLPCGHTRYLVELSTNSKTISCNHCGKIYTPAEVFEKNEEVRRTWLPKFRKSSGASKTPASTTQN
jgi:hypothetical protein